MVAERPGAIAIGEHREEAFPLLGAESRGGAGASPAGRDLSLVLGVLLEFADAALELAWS